MKQNRVSSNRNEKLFNLSPKTVVIGIAVCLGLLLIFGRDIKRFFSNNFQPRISFQNGISQKSKENATSNREIQMAVFDGEVYRTNERLREASAVAVAASITGVAAYMERRPLTDVNELIKSLVGHGLLPPNIELGKEGSVLTSQYGTIHIRFRPSPFAVEIVSLGRARLDGPVLILRVPDEKQNGKTESRYFRSLTLDNVRVPPAFASPTTILSYGWQSDTFKPELPEGVSSQNLSDWINGQK